MTKEAFDEAHAATDALKAADQQNRKRRREVNATEVKKKVKKHQAKAKSKNLYFDRLPMGGDGRYLTYVPWTRKDKPTDAIVAPHEATSDNHAFMMPEYAGSAPIVLARDHNIVLAYQSTHDVLVFIDKRNMDEIEGKN